ncbi:MAG: hypothetical protein JNL83_01170 [Myxococcales bacterium]|nr:hypothetical protein [Myxococcales bacterium]
MREILTRSERPRAVAVFVAIGAVLAPMAASADILSHERLRAYVAAMDTRGATYEQLDTSRAAFIATALIPGWGTYRLEKIVFGEVRPAGIIGDWLVGGALPVGLAIGAYAADDPSTRRALAWTAAGLYAGTRLVILVVGNLHISEYRDALRVKLAPAPGGAAVSFAW